MEPKRAKRARKQDGPRRQDIHDVARRARVSIATVSRTINGVATVDKELAKRVWKAIRELNYFPNTNARALVSGRSRLLGLLVSEITNPFFPELVQGFENVATRYGYEVLLGSTNYEPERMKACIRRMVERNVEGVAVMTFGIEGPLLDELALRQIPMVFVDAAPAQDRMSAIAVNYEKGIREGVQHLAVLGHRKIAFLSGPLAQRSAQMRKAAFLKAAAEIGQEPPAQWVVEGDHTLEGKTAGGRRTSHGGDVLERYDGDRGAARAGALRNRGAGRDFCDRLRRHSSGGVRVSAADDGADGAQRHCESGGGSAALPH
jgi:LacI family transcriptional regulator